MLGGRFFATALFDPAFVVVVVCRLPYTPDRVMAPHQLPFTCCVCFDVRVFSFYFCADLLVSVDLFCVCVAFGVRLSCVRCRDQRAESAFSCLLAFTHPSPVYFWAAGVAAASASHHPPAITGTLLPIHITAFCLGFMNVAFYDRIVVSILPWGGGGQACPPPRTHAAAAGFLSE